MVVQSIKLLLLKGFAVYLVSFYMNKRSGQEK